MDSNYDLLNNSAQNDTTPFQLKGKIKSSKHAIWTRLFAQELTNEKDIGAGSKGRMGDEVAYAGDVEFVEQFKIDN